MAARVVRAVAAAPPGDHLRDQPPPARRRADALSRRRRPRRAHEPHRGRRRAQDPHGQPGHRRLAQHQRRGRDPLRAAAHDDGQGPRRDVPRALQQQDQRRHAAALAAAGNPALAGTITDAIGDGWITDLSQLRKLKPLADDKSFRDAFRKAKREAKAQFADWLKATTGQTVDPDTIFDCQVKRIHEYKRQLLNALRIVVLYNRLRENPNLDMPPRTFFFAGKAAPAYHLAKLIIKFINNLAAHDRRRPGVRGRLKVVFLPDYCVTLAERLIPASDVSNQISTAGYEASGTSNMKFMMNGALTIGTRDGATIEMAEEAGEENFFLFGLTAEQVAGSRGWYNPRWHYDNEPETRAALDLIFSDHFSRDEPGVFAPLRDTLLTRGDHYMHLADLSSYLDADRRLVELYADPDGWSRKAILNVAGSGKFSSDRTIAEYAADIWRVVARLHVRHLDPDAPLLHRAAPDARLLVMLVDPVERFRLMIANSWQRRSAKERTDNRAAETDFLSNSVPRGRYLSQLRNLYDFYPRDRVLVLQYERCVKDPAAEYARTLRFLGVDDAFGRTSSARARCSSPARCSAAPAADSKRSCCPSRRRSSGRTSSSRCSPSSSRTCASSASSCPISTSRCGRASLTWRRRQKLCTHS